MIIGILTLPLQYNYGGLLQNFALQTILKRMGHDVVTLNVPYKANGSFKEKAVDIIKKVLEVLTFSNDKVLGVINFQPTSKILAQNTQLFIEKHINYISFKNPCNQDYDALIVGSDQVWRPMYADLDKTFLAFAKKWNKIIRIAYAASFGTDVWEYTADETKYASELAAMFDAISVRESSGVTLCKNNLGVDASLVLDPTMLLKPVDYYNILNLEDIPQSDGELFFYFLDYSKDKKIAKDSISDKLGLKSFTVNSRVEDVNASIYERIQPPVEQWVRAFMDAKFIITDSFHGTVFSIIFNKPFIVLGNKKRGMARFNSLLGLFGLNDRLVNIDSINNIDINKMMLAPNADMSELYNFSLDFLKNNLKDA